MKPEFGPNPYHPSNWEMIRYYTLPSAGEALKSWFPRINSRIFLRAIGLAPLPLTGSALTPHIALAQEEQPAGQTEQALINQEDYPFVITYNLQGEVQEESTKILPSDFLPLEALSDVNPAEAPKFKTIYPFYTPEVKFVESMGFVATDNLRITHVYDADSGEWTELEKYIPVGTAQERMNQTLQDLLGANKVAAGGTIEYNALGLDPDEVATYLVTGNADHFQSFRILTNSKGEPAILLVTGGLYGFRTDLRIINDMTQAVKRLNEIDPEIIDISTIQFGLRAISADIAPGEIFIRYPNYTSTFDPKLGVIVYRNVPEAQGGTIGHIAMIPNESRGIYNWRHVIGRALQSKDRLSNQYNMDKALWLKAWVERVKANLTPREYIVLTSYADGLIDYFIKYPYA